MFIGFGSATWQIGYCESFQLAEPCHEIRKEPFAKIWWLWVFQCGFANLMLHRFLLMESCQFFYFWEVLAFLVKKSLLNHADHHTTMISSLFWLSYLTVLFFNFSNMVLKMVKFYMYWWTQLFKATICAPSVYLLETSLPQFSIFLFLRFKLF